MGVLAQLQVQVRQGPQKSVFGLLAQAMVVKSSAWYGERFGKRIKRVALLVVKKTWLMCPDLTKRQLGVLAQLQVQVRQGPQKSVF